MKTFIKNFAIEALGKINVYPTWLTDKKQVIGLMENLYPKQTDKKLIRIGPEGDGGYLVPDDLEDINACFSPGVSEVSDFEKECAEMGMDIYLADKSVDAPAVAHENFNFSKKFIGSINSNGFITLDEWVRSELGDAALKNDLLLQIDIEGHEYETFLSTTNHLLERFRIIVAEFHNLDRLWSKPFFHFASRSFEKILETHSCVHIHPNNCYQPLDKFGLEIPPIMEFTFLRNDRINEFSYSSKFPRSLDSDNTDRPTVVLPSCWYKK